MIESLNDEGLAGGDDRRPPFAYRALLRIYPRWFRVEIGTQLLAHLLLERREERYGGLAGGLRFWARGLADALRVSGTLQLERLKERVSGRLDHGSEGVPPGLPKRGRRYNLEVGVEGLMRDLRLAFRGLSKNPGYATVFVVTLGLGIGANTAMFSAVNGVLLRPLPHQDGESLVYLRHAAPVAGIENALFSVPEIEDYRQGTPSLDAVAEFSALTFTMLGYDVPRRVRAGIVTGNYFPVMGLSAALGRTIGPEDDGETAPAVIVLSHAYWRNELGSDPDILGKTVEMNGRTATIVGVSEPSPPYPERTDIYVNMATSPHHLDASMNHDRVHRMTEVFARLAPDATVESVRSEVSVVSSRIHADYAEAYDAGSGFQVSVTPLKTQLTTRARPTLLLLLATAGFVLIIACANLANLTLTRVLRRGHELAIRASLGGGRNTLRRELLIESLILSLLGAGLGLVIAAVSVDLLVAFAARFTSRASEITLDAPVFGFALLAGILASGFFTLLPPLPRGDRLGSLLTKSGTRTTIGSGARRVQRMLVVAQVATSFVLLMGAGLLVRTMAHLSRVDPGFDTDQVVAMSIPANRAGRSSAELRAHYLSVLDGVRALPGVESASLASQVPLGNEGALSVLWEVDVEGHEPAPGAPTPRATFRVVTPDYFSTMGIDLVAGRSFQITDDTDAQPVLIINEAMARSYFSDRDAVGRQIAWVDDVVKFLGLGNEYRTVVGVAADTRDYGVDADAGHVVYMPYPQVTPVFTGDLLVRVRQEPAQVLPAIREEILAHDPNQPIANVATIADLGTEAMAPRRLNATLLTAFAILALVISAVGIGGVLAFSVGSRRREFGVRAALGAVRSQIWSGVVSEGARLAIAGLVLGSLGAVALSGFIASLLVGVPALDPLTFLGVALLLGGVAVLAAWIPAWRAASVSPTEAMASD